MACLINMSPEKFDKNNQLVSMKYKLNFYFFTPLGIITFRKGTEGVYFYEQKEDSEAKQRKEERIRKRWEKRGEAVNPGGTSLSRK